MCAKCQASIALTKEMLKQVRFPDDPRSAEDIWWSDDVDKETAEQWGRLAYGVSQGLEARGFEIVEIEGR